MKINTIFLCTILLLGPFFAHAQDVTLSWDPSPSSSVAGYKIYYSQDNSSFPLTGSGAIEGDSPIDVGNSLSATLNGLDDGSVYYFSVTAYDYDSNESDFSNIVNSGWQPELVLPAANETDVPLPGYFEWETAPVDYDVSYILFYGTDKSEIENAGLLPPGNQPHNRFPLSYVIVISLSLSAFLVLLTNRLHLCRRKHHAPATIMATVVLAFALTACGGGGSGSSGISDSGDSSSVIDTGSENNDSTNGNFFNSIDVGTVAYHEVYDLEPGTTYYWKVVAIDEINTDMEYQSKVLSFTTVQ